MLLSAHTFAPRSAYIGCWDKLNDLHDIPFLLPTSNVYIHHMTLQGRLLYTLPWRKICFCHIQDCAVGPPRICTKPVKTAGLYNETDVIDIVEGTQLRIPDTRTAGGEVFLSDPYSMKHAFPISGLGGSMLPNVRAIQSVMEEPSQAALEILVDAFLSRFFERGFFFLESLQFRQSTLLSLPFGHPDRPSPGLLGVVYLWGSYISSKRRQPVHDYTEEDLIGLAVHNLAQDTVHVTGPMTHLPQFFFHTVQAEVLLSLWYLNSGQRVNALWAVLALDKLWAVASGLPSSVLFETSALIRCPMFNIAQENPSMLPLMSTIDTHFGHPPFAFLAKAALFLERSITVGNGPAGGYSPAQFNDSPHWSELQNPPEVFILALQVDNFRTSLPSLARNNGFSVNHTLLVTHCLTNVAIIRLNAPHILNYPDSIGRAFLAAEQVVSDILLVETLAWDQVNPILGSSVRRPEGHRQFTDTSERHVKACRALADNPTLLRGHSGILLFHG
ncbi:hypothetical protein B0H13DRAFT_1904873 [Mycena leptocephala]|nr:hypothetical protein B0H13DRAFT_1904873 [Mycena leptocephala]